MLLTLKTAHFNKVWTHRHKSRFIWFRRHKLPQCNLSVPPPACLSVCLSLCHAMRKVYLGSPSFHLPPFFFPLCLLLPVFLFQADKQPRLCVRLSPVVGAPVPAFEMRYPRCCTGGFSSPHSCWIQPWCLLKNCPVFLFPPFNDDKRATATTSGLEDGGHKGKKVNDRVIWLVYYR